MPGGAAQNLLAACTQVEEGAAGCLHLDLSLIRDHQGAFDRWCSVQLSLVDELERGVRALETPMLGLPVHAAPRVIIGNAVIIELVRLSLLMLGLLGKSVYRSIDAHEHMSFSPGMSRLLMLQSDTSCGGQTIEASVRHPPLSCILHERSCLHSAGAAAQAWQLVRGAVPPACSAQPGRVHITLQSEHVNAG